MLEIMQNKHKKTYLIKGIFSKSTNDIQKVTSISKSVGVVSYNSTARTRGFLRNELFQTSNTYENIFPLCFYKGNFFMAETAVSQ